MTHYCHVNEQHHLITETCTLKVPLHALKVHILIETGVTDWWKINNQDVTHLSRRVISTELRRADRWLSPSGTKRDFKILFHCEGGTFNVEVLVSVSAPLATSEAACRWDRPGALSPSAPADLGPPCRKRPCPCSGASCGFRNDPLLLGAATADSSADCGRWVGVARPRVGHFLFLLRKKDAQNPVISFNLNCAACRTPPGATIPKKDDTQSQKAASADSNGAVLAAISKQGAELTKVSKPVDGLHLRLLFICSSGQTPWCWMSRGPHGCGLLSSLPSYHGSGNNMEGVTCCWRPSQSQTSWFRRLRSRL